MRLATIPEFRKGRLDRSYRVLDKRPKTLGELLEAFDIIVNCIPPELNLNSAVPLCRFEGRNDELTYAYITEGEINYFIVPNKDGLSVIKKVIPVYGVKI
ncbi:MAG: hypothetical protein Q8R00_02590 [Candidatus Nanoarchaeia archaeon]|nr:hypothetical protein [Candidatus Nanoarchaeia archaeon]